MKKFGLIIFAAALAILGVAVGALAVFATVSVAVGIVYIAQDIARICKEK